MKGKILADFKEKLSNISDRDTLLHFVTDFKDSKAYKVLSTGQDLATKLLPIKTDSVKEVERLIAEKEEQLKEPTYGSEI